MGLQEIQNSLVDKRSNLFVACILMVMVMFWGIGYEEYHMVLFNVEKLNQFVLNTKKNVVLINLVSK